MRMKGSAQFIEGSGIRGKHDASIPGAKVNTPNKYQNALIRATFRPEVRAVPFFNTFHESDALISAQKCPPTMQNVLLPQKIENYAKCPPTVHNVLLL